MADVFISYSQADRGRVSALVDAIRKRGWSVWWDADGRAGADLDEMVNEQLNHASCILVVWSTHSVGSDWVLGEADVGRTRRVLIPVLIDQVETPLRFRGRNAVNLTNWDGKSDSQDIQRVVDGIEFFACAPAAESQSIRTKGYEVALDRMDRGVDKSKFFSILNGDDPICLLERFGWRVGSYNLLEVQYYYLRISHSSVASGSEIGVTRVFELERLKKLQSATWRTRMDRRSPILVLDFSYVQLLEDPSASAGGWLYRVSFEPVEFYAPLAQWSERLSKLL